MWLGHDFGWWGFVFGAAALILAIPMTIFGNIITPRLLNWWAERSARSSRKRIIKLTALLCEYEKNYPLITDLQDLILTLLRGFAMLFLMVMEFSMFIIAFVTKIAHYTLDSHNWVQTTYPQMKIVALVTFLLAGGYIFSMVYEIFSFQTKRSPKSRKSIATSIATLKSRLDQ